MRVNRSIIKITFLFSLILIVFLFGGYKVHADDYLYTDDYKYKISNDGTYVSIYRLLNKTATEIVIPETIDGLPVKTLTAYFTSPDYGEEPAAVKKITLPSTISSLGNSEKSAFENAINLEEIIVDPNNEYFCSDNGVVYNKDKTKLVFYPCNKAGDSFEVPSTVTLLYPEAFAFNQKLKNVILPNTITKLQYGTFTYSKIESISLPSSIKMSDCYNFYKCTELKTAYIDCSYAGLDDFESCTSLTKVTFGPNTTLIRKDAFKDCTSLKEINFCEGLIEIDESAFENCNALPKTISIPSTVEWYYKNSFPDGITLKQNRNDYVELRDSYVVCEKFKVDGEQKYDYAYEVVNQVNEQRKNNNLGELKTDKNLTNIAMQRAYEISLYYAHHRPEVFRGYAFGGYDIAFFKDTLYRNNLLNVISFNGENIASGYTSSSSAMNGWMNSAGHRANILTADYTNIGVGCVKTKYGYFWVQIFGSDTLTPETPRSNKQEVREIPIQKYLLEETLKINVKSYIKAGDTANSTVTIRLEDANSTSYIDPTNLTWSSSNNKVATVNNQGVVTGISNGEVSITATTPGGISASRSITVYGSSNTNTNTNTNTNSNPNSQTSTNTNNNNNNQNNQNNSDTKSTSSNTDKQTTTKETNNGSQSSSSTNKNSTASSQPSQNNNSNNLPFKDVKSSDWFYAAVKFNYENKFISGYNATTFAPNDKLTRGMIVTILYKMEGSPNTSGNSRFSDVSSNEWFSKPIKWAVDNGIVHGYGGTNNFGPNDNIIRQDLAGILRNYASYKKKDTKATSGISSFKDYKLVDDYALSAVQWAVSKGVITGNADGTLNPKGNATRAEAAAMIQKYCNKVGR